MSMQIREQKHNKSKIFDELTEAIEDVRDDISDQKYLALYNAGKNFFDTCKNSE